MRRHLRLVTSEGGNFVEPQPAPPNPTIEVDEALVDLAINVLDLLLASREAHRLGVTDAEGVHRRTPKPSKPTKTKGAQQP